MEAAAVSGRLWRRFRRLAGWAQLSIVFAAVVVLAAPFTSDAQQTAGPGTTSSVEAAREVTTRVPATVTTSGAPSRLAAGDDVDVVRVIDGDTIVVSGDVRVRLIGVDTPETVDPSRPVECFGPESSRYLHELLPVGTTIRLVYDVERLDRYGRTLAYVYKLTDGVFVNLAVARNGFAVQLTVPPNVAHAEEFRVAVAQARVASLGRWRDCQPTSTTPAPITVAPTVPPAAPTTRATVPQTTVTTVARVTTSTPAAGGACHPSYAGACVPTGFSDVDCAGGSGNGPGYVSAKNFQVVGPDVYGLDADGDGIACESR